MRHALYMITGMLTLTLGCDADDNYPVEPFIEFESLTFKVSPGEANMDTMKLTFSFRDGDNDLGLAPDQTSAPYNRKNFFLAHNGNLIPVTAFTGVTNEIPPRTFSQVIDLQDQVGKLATLKTESEPEYGFMPDYVAPYTCTHYEDEILYLEQGDLSIIDETYTIVDTVTINWSFNLYAVREKFYFEINENYYTIIVNYLEELPDGTFQKIAWENEVCANFNGRFPDISNLTTFTGPRLNHFGPFEIRKVSKWSGTMTYNMMSNGFIPLLSGKKIKLNIRIKDRALHDSNVIETDVIQF